METQYDFDDIVNRRNTNCGRWDTMDKKYGTRDMIHLGVADMDFRAPVEIRDSLHKILDMGVLGYTDLSDKFFLSIQRWYKKQYNMDIPRDGSFFVQESILHPVYVWKHIQKKVTVLLCIHLHMVHCRIQF